MSITKAPCIRGHEVIVNRFEQNCGNIEKLPENYVIKDDYYYANYRNGNVEWSKIAKKQNPLVNKYIPRVGELVEASVFGRDEPDIFYLALAKYSYQHTDFEGSSYSTQCSILFVRTNKKQLSHFVYRVTARVNPYDYDYSLEWCKMWERKGVKVNHKQALAAFADRCGYGVQYEVEVKEYKKRVSETAYFNHKKREERLSLATPMWVSKYDLNALKAQTAKMNKKAGYVKYHLDHKYPIHLVCDGKYSRTKDGWKKGKHIGCGLNAPHNLEHILASDNLRKSNRIVT